MTCSAQVESSHSWSATALRSLPTTVNTMRMQESFAQQVGRGLALCMDSVRSVYYDIEKFVNLPKLHDKRMDLLVTLVEVV